jgi:hypothetical protein
VFGFKCFLGFTGLGYPAIAGQLRHIRANLSEMIRWKIEQGTDLSVLGFIIGRMVLPRSVIERAVTRRQENGGWSDRVGGRRQRRRG